MSKNMNSLDRRVRALLLAPAAIITGILVGPGSAAAIVLYAFAVVMLATSSVGRCALYSVLRLGRRGRQSLTH